MGLFELDQIAIQMFTLRDQCRTLPDLISTLGKVRDIGYRAVQISQIDASPADIRKALDDTGLVCCATHEPADRILGQPREICERLDLFGCAHTAYPFPRNVDFRSEESIGGLVRQLNAAGKVFAENGKTLSYHNHALEFVRYGEATVLDHIFAATDPAFLKAELDTYWIQYGGGDPVTWCEKLKNRMPLVHVKDYGIDSENKPTYCEIGHGNLDWQKILQAAKNSGCQWIIVEQDTCPGDPFVSIRQSFDYLKNLLEP